MTDSDTDAQEKLAAQWARVRGRLRQEFGEATFRSWLKPLTLAGRRGADLRVSVPSRFMRDWVATHYADRLSTLWSSENPDIRSVEIVVDAEIYAKPAIDDGTEAPASPALTRDLESESTDDWSANLDPRLTFDNFVAGKSNELAEVAAFRVAEADHVPVNPLFLYGGAGLGKTHLMQAIANHIRRSKPQKRVIYFSAEKFMYQFIRALRLKDTLGFREHMCTADVLIVDDVQFIIGKGSTQEEFFHAFNFLFDQNRQIVLSADKPPSGLQDLDERMRSRFGQGMVVEIEPMDYELRLRILEATAKRTEKPIPDAVLEFLAREITSNARQLEGALTRIVMHASLIGQPITIESTQELLKDLLRANHRRVTIEEIQRRVAEHFNIKQADMQSPRRARQVARPRQVAMYLAKQLTTRSLPEIGRRFGGRDHMTVMHAVKKVEELCAADSAFLEDVELLRKLLTDY